MNSIFIAINMFKRVFSDRKALLSFLFPALILSIIVSLVGRDASADPIKVLYANMDQGSLGTQLVSLIEQEDGFQLIETTESELKESIISRKHWVGLVIPGDFTEKMMVSENPQVENYFLTISESSILLEQTLNQKIGQLARSISIAQIMHQDQQQVLETVKQIVNEQGNHQVASTITDLNLSINSGLYLVIGFMLFFVMSLIMNSLGLVLEDRSQMTMARIYTAPVRAFEIALGNFLGSYGLGIMQLLIILVITKYIIGYDFGVGFLPMFVVLGFFLLAAVGIGTAVAGVVKNNNNAGAINSLVITPTCMIGGCWWPVSIMPAFMQKLANFVPQRWAIDAIEKLAGGETLVQVSMQLGILTLFAVILLGFGAVVLRPSEEAV